MCVCVCVCFNWVTNLRSCECPSHIPLKMTHIKVDLSKMYKMEIWIKIISTSNTTITVVCQSKHRIKWNWICYKRNIVPRNRVIHWKHLYKQTRCRNMNWMQSQSNTFSTVECKTTSKWDNFLSFIRVCFLFFFFFVFFFVFKEKWEYLFLIGDN